jgi:ABC-type glycerol-3-phosphate transport system substrate-binding protein
MRHLRGATGIGLGALLALAACSSVPAASETPPSVAPPSAVTATGPTAVKAVKSGTEVYHEAMDAFVAASNKGTTDTAELGKYASGRALMTFQGILGSYRQQGLHTSGEPRIDEPVVTGLTPATDPTGVQLRGCIDISAWPVTKADGSPADKVGGQQNSGPSVILANVAKTGAAWQVTELTIQGPCPA